MRVRDDKPVIQSGLRMVVERGSVDGWGNSKERERNTTDRESEGEESKEGIQIEHE